MRGEERPHEGYIDLVCLGHPVASLLEQRGDPGAGLPFEDNFGPVAQGPPKTPTAAVAGAAAEDHAFANTTYDDDEEEGYSSCSDGPESDFGEEIGVDPRQITLTMHWSQVAFQDTREPGEVL